MNAIKKNTLSVLCMFAFTATCSYATNYNPTDSFQTRTTDVEDVYYVNLSSLNVSGSNNYYILGSDADVYTSNYSSETNALVKSENALSITIDASTTVGSLYLYESDSESNIYGNVAFTMKDGSVAMSSSSSNEAIVLGANGTSDSVIWGNTVVSIQGGQVGGSIFAAGGGTLIGKTYVSVMGGTIYGQGSTLLNGTDSDGSNGAIGIYGGSYGGTVEGYTEVSVSGGTVETNVNGAGSSLSSIVAGNTTVRVSGGDVYGDVTGGSLDENGLAVGRVYGNTSVQITGGDVYIRDTDTGDGYLSSTLIANTGSVYGMTGVVDGDVSVSVYGGSTIEGDVYGAGLALAEKVTVYYAVDSGDVIYDTTGLIEGEDYTAQTYTYSHIGGDLSVQISDDSSSSLGTLIYGKISATDGYATIDGKATLSMTYYNNTSLGYYQVVEGFNTTYIKGSTLNLEADYSYQTTDSAALVSIKTEGGVNSTVNFNDSTFDNNNIIRTGGTDVISAGVMVVDTGSVVTFTGDTTFNNNKIISSSEGFSPNGGIIYASGSATLTGVEANYNYVEINQNNEDYEYGSSASTQISGGLFYAQGSAGEIIVTDSDFSYNTITSKNTIGQNTLAGGVFAAMSGGYIDISGSTFSENDISNFSHLTQGGVIWVNAGTAKVSNTTFSDNTVSVGSNGTYYIRGAIFGNYAGYSELTDVTFDSNTATSASSGIEGVAFFAKKTSSTSILTDVTFTNNAAIYTGTSSYAAGAGILLSDGASITYNAKKDITNYGNYVSIGGSKTDEFGGFLYFGDGEGAVSTATFNVSSGATLTIGNGSEGEDSIASYDNTAVLVKAGAGTMTVNSSMEFFTGTLNVTVGTMEVNNVLGASSINVSSGATLSATINDNYTFSNDSLTVSNAGTLKLIAGIDLDSGSYTISSNTDLDFDSSSIGAIAYGGTIENNTFIVAAASEITLASTNTTVTNNGRIEIDTSSSSSSVDSVVMSFNASSATLESVKDVSSNLESAIVSESSSITVLAAFDFDITLTSGDSVVLSFLVGDGYNLSDFTIYHSTDNTEWDVASEISDLTYDGEYLSFIVESFSSYGVAVPEPSTYAMIFGALALGLAVYRRRK